MQDWKLEPSHDLGLSPSQRWRSLQRENGLLESLSQWTWRAVLRSYLTTVHRLRVSGREHLPAAPPFVLVANHTSHLDALCISAALPARLREQVFPLAAGDTFFETPALAAFSTFFLNALPMWRHNCGRHALADLRARIIEQPCGVILFPEGTRSRDGVLQPFKPGLGMLVAGSPIPVIPCRIGGAFEALPPQRSIPRPWRVHVNIGPALRFESAPNGRAGWEAVAAAAFAAVAVLAG